MTDTVEAMRARVLAVIESGGSRIGAHRDINQQVLCEHGLYDFQDCIGCYDECLMAALDNRTPPP